MAAPTRHPGAPPRLLCVVGARPNFMKIAPIMAALQAMRSPRRIEALLLHTGQHYDRAMSEQYFSSLSIPEPDINLGVGPGSQTVQTAEIMLRFEPVLDEFRPDAVLVVGDVSSTLACALVACKKAIPVIHVEAGLRSFDRTMPEEVNRILTDQVSDLLFTSERSGYQNLIREGIDGARIRFAGNVMIDTLFRHLERAVPACEQVDGIHRSALSARGSGFAVVTLHRPANVDAPGVLQPLLKAVSGVANRLPVIFPLHPRTAAKIGEFGMDRWLDRPEILRMPPLGYLEMLGLMRDARMVLTDSGGIQEETTALGVPCITLRDSTERPVTEREGTNTVVGTVPERILAAVDDVLETGGKRGRIPELWDGRAANRIVASIRDWFDWRVPGSAG